MPVRWILEPGAPGIDVGDTEPPTEDLYRLACRLARARLYIGNDSGITHLAAAAGTRVLALFGPTDPARWAPRGESVEILGTPEASEAMESISLKRVATAAFAWLAAPPRAFQSRESKRAVALRKGGLDRPHKSRLG